MLRALASFLDRFRAIGPARRAVIGASLAVLGLITTGAAAALHYEYRVVADSVLAQNEQLALKLAGRTAEVLDQVEQTLRLLVHFANHDPETTLATLASSDLIATRTTRAVLIADADGHIVDSTSGLLPLNIADEDEFKRLKATPQAGISIGLPALNPLSNQWSVPVWRRLTQPDGRFGGVAMVDVDPAALTSHAAFGDAPDSVVGVLGLDNIYRARMAGGTSLKVGEKLEVPFLLKRVAQMRRDRQPIKSPLDGTVRFSAAVEVPRYPLMAVVATDAATSLAVYTDTRSAVLGFAGTLTLTTVAIAALLWNLLGRLEASRRAARRSDRVFRAAVDGSLDSVVILAAVRASDGTLIDMRISDANPRAAGLVDDRREALIGRSLSDVAPTIVSGGFLVHFDWVIRNRRVSSAEVEATDPHVAGRWFHHQIVPLDDGVALISRDVTEAKELARQLDALARHDALTKLPNRRHFEESLQQARARARRTGLPIAFLYIDLDGFKRVNDTLGHEGGDLLLQSTALRLLDCIRSTDLVARLGGDEFAVLLEPVGDGERIQEVCERVLAALSNEHLIDDHAVVATPSIGAVLLRHDESDVSFRRRADEAMYEAKRAGKAQYRFDATSVG